MAHRRENRVSKRLITTNFRTHWSIRPITYTLYRLPIANRISNKLLLIKLLKKKVMLVELVELLNGHYSWTHTASRPNRLTPQKQSQCQSQYQSQSDEKQHVNCSHTIKTEKNENKTKTRTWLSNAALFGRAQWQSAFSETLGTQSTIATKNTMNPKTSRTHKIILRFDWSLRAECQNKASAWARTADHQDCSLKWSP